MTGLFRLMGGVTSRRPFSMRERGILVAACASALGDSCCAFAWGTKLAGIADPGLAAGVLSDDDSKLSAAERAMAAWARLVVRDPGRTTASDVQALRDVGFSDDDIFAMTVYVALRLAQSTARWLARLPARILDARMAKQPHPPVHRQRSLASRGRRRLSLQRNLASRGRRRLSLQRAHVAGGEPVAGDPPVATAYLLDEDPGDRPEVLALDLDHRVGDLVDLSCFCCGVKTPSMTFTVTIGMAVLLP
jgi:hypothetical protein